MLTTEDVQKMIESHISGAQVVVRDLTGTSDHFAVRVVSKAFEDKSLVQQHQMIYASVGNHMTREIHALQIETALPEGNTS